MIADDERRADVRHRARATDVGRAADASVAGTRPLEIDSSQLEFLARQLAAARERIGHLETALQTNRHIAMAIGILMARRGLTEDQAFTELRLVSQCRHRKLRDVAEEVVLTGDLP